VSISTVFVTRPVATTLLTAGVALAGVLGFRLLPVSALPQVDFPTLQVTASLPGASPETMATSVAAPLERHFGRIAGITEMTSTSYLGSTTIVLQFNLERSLDGAARDVQAAINAARGYLPANLPANPVYRKVNPADAPILILALTSDTLSTGRMHDAAASILQQQISQVEGVGQVFVGGSTLPAVRVELNPLALSRHGLGLDDVRRVLSSTTVRLPKGQVTDGERTWELETDDQLVGAEAYRSLVLASGPHGVLRLSDVASVEDSVEDLRTGGLANGRPAVMLIVFRTPGANVIATVDRVRALLPQLKALLPAAIDFSVTLDRTPPIRASLADVELALAIAVALVILVVFAFLRDVRAALIPSVAVPVSLIGTFGVMYLLDYGLDNLSLMALTIATGFVVDDAIVVLENVSRHVERGVPPRQAALVGAREISFTVLSMSASLVAVFIPILLMGGMVGRLFREFAVTLSVAVGISLAVSLATTPMMCARLLRPERHGGHGRLWRATEAVGASIARLYQVSLSWSLRHRGLVLFLTLVTVAVNIVLFVHVPKGFFPQQDTGRLTGMVQASQDTSFQAMWEKLRTVIEVIRSDPAVDGVEGFTGAGMGGGAARNTARMFIALKPPGERDAGTDQVLTRLRRELAKFPGTPTFLQAIQDLRIGGRITSAQYQYTLQGEEVGELTAWGPRILEQLRALPQLSDVSSDQQDRGLESNLVVDRDLAARLGLSFQDIDDALYDAFGQRQVAITYTPLNQYRVVMEVAPRFWQSPDTLRDFHVRSPAGAQVPLGAFARFEAASTTLAVNRQAQFPSVTLSFNVTPGVALGEAVAAVEEAAREAGMPPTIRGSFQGAAQAFQASLANQPLLILAALITVYIVLGILYESYIHPITILSTLPSAGVGAILALLLCRVEFTVIALIGIILLIGIVKKNAILMIDFALVAERQDGLSPEQAIYQACLLRFRPILMTTMAALLGALPLALSRGVGSELRRPLGIAIVGGLIVSQALTLYTTPVVYIYLDRLQAWWRGLRGREPAGAAAQGSAG
jgi:multidrug efflux pump